MSELFKKKPLDQRRTIRYEILLSQKEAEDIRAFALLRNLSVADYMRRSSLHRRTDISYETEMILTLREVVQSIRRLHATCAANAIQLPTVELARLIDEVLAAILRVDK